MMASPTATSAAAMAIENSANACPEASAVPCNTVWYELNATRLMFAALSMISMHMSTTMAFLRVMTP